MHAIVAAGLLLGISIVCLPTLRILTYIKKMKRHNSYGYGLSMNRIIHSSSATNNPSVLFILMFAINTASNKRGGR